MTAASAQHCCGCSCPLLRHGGSGGADTSSTQGRGGGRAGWGKLNEGPLSGPLFFLHWRSSFRCRSLRCATHSTIHAKNAKSVFHGESNPLPRVLKVYDLPTGPKRSCLRRKLSRNQLKGYETRLTYPGTQGTVSTQSTPHPRVKVTPAGRGPCELGWELRDQARFKFPIPDSACREY